MKDSYIGQAWLVLLLALAFGGMLAGVQASLSGRIEENKRRETYDQIPSLVVIRDRRTGKVATRADAAKTVEVVTDQGKVAYHAFSSYGKPVGWVIKGAGQGFADRIELLVGLNDDATKILGMYVLDQKETPALGDKIRGEDFRDRFRDRFTKEPLVARPVVTDASAGNKIQAVVGATISSRSVCDIVNAAVADFKPWLAAYQAKGADERPGGEED